VGSQHDVRVKDSDERIQIAVPRRP
jgi:hypothetical protein